MTCARGRITQAEFEAKKAELLEPHVRVVSLVPSVTETLLAWDIAPVAVTRFCEHPELPARRRHEGPGHRAIVAMAPDLVVVYDEENRREDADALEARGLRCTSCPSSRSTPSRPSRRLQRARPCWSSARRPDAAAVAGADPRTRAFVPIWRRPWMTMNGDTYGSSVLALDRCRQRVRRARASAIPRSTLDEPRPRPDVVLAPSEPYPVRPRATRDELEHGRAGRVRRRPGPVLVGRAHAGRARAAGTAAHSSVTRSADRTHGPALRRTAPAFGQGDDAAAEARPGQAGTEHSRRAREVVRRAVECRRRHLVVVAQARVAVVHHAPGITNERPRMTRSTTNPLARSRRRRGGRARARRVGDLPDRLDLRVAQRADELLRAARTLARRSAYTDEPRARVLARVDHDHLDVLGQRTGVIVRVAAVDQQRGALDSAGRCELVHDPAGHARGSLLGPLAGQRDVERSTRRHR